MLLPDTGRFLVVLQRLLLNVPGPFVLVAPTSRHRTIEAQELMEPRGISFFSLEEQLVLDDDGRVVALAQQGGPGEIRPTPLADRKRVVKEFVQRSHCKVRDIQEAAGVDEADYYKWLRGATPDHYSTCAAIERVLHQGLPERHEQGTEED